MSPNTSELYATVDSLLFQSAGGSVGGTVLLQPRPMLLERAVLEQRRRRSEALRRFFGICSSIFDRALKQQENPRVLDLLLNDTPAHLREEFHLSIGPELYTQPLFFRTDEASDGSIYELQCPGSGWGDLQLLADSYVRIGCTEPSLIEARPAREFAEQVQAVCQNESPTVLHLLDNASAPTGMRYHMSTTGPPLRYWGWHKGVNYSSVDLVRTHSFIGLTAENYFWPRVAAAREGRTQFDLPPMVLFDQKAPSALPFWDLTREYFDDEIREQLTYTYPITAEGFRDVTGEWVNLEQFCARSSRARHYYVKYAGSDVSRNWGSRSVFRLAGNDCSRLLQRAAVGATRGEHWVIQPERSAKARVEFVHPGTGLVSSVMATEKVSSFYGPGGLIGLKSMHRGHFKVHGQDDTIVGLILANTGRA